MNVSLDDVSAFAESYINAPDAQGGAALLAYSLARGYSFADSTSVLEAHRLLFEVAAATAPEPEAAEGRILLASSRYLKHRARCDGEGYSVADCNRVNWYNRKRSAWGAAFSGAPWPGGKPWQALRMHHLTQQGWTPAEIARALQLTPRSVRTKLEAISPGPEPFDPFLTKENPVDHF